MGENGWERRISSLQIVGIEEEESGNFVMSLTNRMKGEWIPGAHQRMHGMEKKGSHSENNLNGKMQASRVSEAES